MLWALCALLLLLPGPPALGESCRLPVRVHTLAACGQGALALTYTGEVFFIGTDGSAAQVAPMLPEGEPAYLAGLCNGPSDMLYAAVYVPDGPTVIAQAALQGEILALSPLGTAEVGDGNFRMYDMLADSSGALLATNQESHYWDAATMETVPSAASLGRLSACAGGKIISYRDTQGRIELVQLDAAAPTAQTLRELPRIPGALAVSPDGRLFAWCADALVTAWRKDTEQLLQGYMEAADTSAAYPCCLTNDGVFYYANVEAVSCIQLAEDYAPDVGSLVIGQTGMENSMTVRYRLANPEVSVVTRMLDETESSPAAIAQSIRTQDSSVDIYLIRTNATGYQALLEKGFCADLSAEAGLVRQVQDMPDCFAEAVTVDGQLRAIPFSVVFDSSSTLGCSQSAFDALGISISELPSSTDALLDCILSWIDAGMLDDFWLHDRHQERSLLYCLALNGYVSHACQANGTVDLSSPEFTALMMKLDQVVQWINTRSQPDDDAPALFSQKSLQYFLTSPAEDDWKMLLLSPYPSMTPFFGVALDVAIVNPLSRHREEAVAFLEYLLAEAPPETAMLLWPARAQPVENPDYIQQRDFYQSELLRLQAALESGQGSPQQKQALSDALEDAQAALDQLEPTRWRISPQAIASYTAAVPSLVVLQDSALGLVYDAGGLAIEQRYDAQQASMEELLEAFAHLYASITLEQ